jgi:hypothetical protein
MVLSLRAHPCPQRLVLLAPACHHARAIVLFELDWLLMLLVPDLFVWLIANSADAVIFPSKSDFV